MIEEWLFPVTLLAAVGCGLNGGVFFAFSAFIMKGLARLPPTEGNVAMQAINIAAVTPPFMVALFGTAGVCVALSVAAVRRWSQPGAGWLLAGSLLYLIGAIGVTVAFNVPRNDALAAVAADTSDGATRWAAYMPSWTAWNTVRTVAAVVAAVILIVAAFAGRGWHLTAGASPD